MYSSPGLDLGSLLSGVVLAAVHQRFDSAKGRGRDKREGRSEEGGASTGVTALKIFAIDFLSSYRTASTLSEPLFDASVVDCLGFAACEVARTALGFAGVRSWLNFEEEKKKKRALDKAVRVAKLMMEERGEGVETLKKAFDFI